MPPEANYNQHFKGYSQLTKRLCLLQPYLFSSPGRIFLTHILLEQIVFVFVNESNLDLTPEL